MDNPKTFTYGTLEYISWEIPLKIPEYLNISSPQQFVGNVRIETKTGFPLGPDLWSYFTMQTTERQIFLKHL